MELIITIFIFFFFLIPILLTYIHFNKKNHSKIYQRIKRFYGFKFLIFSFSIMFFAVCFDKFIFCDYDVNTFIILFLIFISITVVGAYFCFIYVIKYFFEKYKLSNKIFNYLYISFLLFTIYLALDFSNAYSFLLNGSCSSCSSCEFL